MKKVKVLVLSGFGLNCDYETIYSFSLVKADAQKVHINSLINGEVNLNDFQVLVFGGGFSWGDYHGAGNLQAIIMKTKIGDEINKFIENKKLILGICNGFQTLVNMGLLPGFENGKYKREVALINNDCGNFRDEWVYLKINKKSKCVFTQGIDFMELPIRHGEGKFYCENSVVEKLKKSNQVVMQYSLKNGTPAKNSFPENPNGSLYDIAGICDNTGRIFGLMPHPEAFNHFTNHPDWTRDTIDNSMSIKLFHNAINYFK